MRAREKPIYAGSDEDGRYRVSTNKGTVLTFDTATDAGAYFGSDLLTELLLAEDEERAIRVFAEREHRRNGRKDVYATLGATFATVSGLFVAAITVAYYLI